MICVPNWAYADTELDVIGDTELNFYVTKLAVVPNWILPISNSSGRE